MRQKSTFTLAGLHYSGCSFRTHIGMLSLLTLIFLGAGCSNVRITNPARTATEQFLLSQAAVEAVTPLSFDVLHGRKVYLDSSYFAPVEKEFVLGELRAKVLNSGVQIVNKREDAQIILEIRSGGVGIDRYESLLGIPSLMTPSTATSAVSGTPMASLVTPELAISKTIKQVAFASVAYVAYWADTGEVVASIGPTIGKTHREDWWFLGFGPKSLGNIPPVNFEIE
ncbi:MAG: hypothetical protein K9M57_09150 [Phycisphaerae bacterium]|nr:hypothetical protein [Phycisphaerae bacterium]